VKTEIGVNAALIFVLSEAGTTGRYISKFGPPGHVNCLTPDSTVARQSSGVLQGYHAFLFDTLEASHALAVEVSIEAIKAGVAQEGDLMVVVAGKTFGDVATDRVRVGVVSSHYWDEAIREAGATVHHQGRPDSVGHLKANFRIPIHA
jgi:pyruvate kinase